MQQQINKQTVDNAASRVLDAVKQQFETTMFQEPVVVEKEKVHRIVKLIYKSCCGCGCHDQNIFRVVDEDSSLTDGTRIQTLEERDYSNYDGALRYMKTL